MRGRSALLGIAAAWCALIWLWRPAVFALPVDDAHYYIVVAQNLVAGLGWTFDGLVPTNGVHPLWVLAIAPLAALPLQIDELVRCVLTLQVGLVVGAVLLLAAGLSRAARVGAVGADEVPERLKLVAALFLLHPYAAKIVLCGQESALAFALICAALGLWLRLRAAADQPPASAWLLLGLITGLAPLARLELAIFSFGLWAIELLKGSGRGRNAGALLALAPLVCWWGFSASHFDSLIPVSGAIKIWEAPPPPLGSSVLMSLVWGGALTWLWRQTGWRQEWAPLFVLCLFVALTSTWLLARPLPHLWYLQPVLLLSLLAGAGMISSASPLRRRSIVLGCSVLVGFAAVGWAYRLQPGSYRIYAEQAAAGEWIAVHVPADARVGGWDVGFLAARARRPVTNLEGLVGDQVFFEQFLKPGQVERFVEEAPIEWLSQYYSRSELLAQAAGRRPLALEGGVSPARFRVARARCFDVRLVTAPMPTPYVQLVLSRSGPGPRFEDFVRELGRGVCRPR